MGIRLKLTVRQMHLDLFLPSSKRCKRTVDLFGNIKSEESTVRVLGTKVGFTSS